MRFTTIAQLALAAAPALVSADTGSLGFALGAKTAGGSCKGPSDYAADLDFLHKQTGTTIVRGYSATSCNEDGSCCNFAANILPVAREKGFQVIIGIWPDDPVSLQKEKDALATLVPQFKDVIYAVTVGSESLYRRALTGEQLNNIIGDVKSLIGSDIKVGSADSWNNYTDFAASPLYGDNGHATILNASRTLFDDLGQAFDLIQSKKPDMEIWVGETGWPSAGTDYHAAKSGLDNAHQFWQEGICSLLTWGFNTFAFEAFDESWKPITKGLDGTEADETNWGVFKADYSIKYDLECPAASDSERSRLELEKHAPIIPVFKVLENFIIIARCFVQSSSVSMILLVVTLWITMINPALALVASPSSPPALLQEEYHQLPSISSFNDGGSPRSTASTAWTAPSPSQLEQPTSPILPPRPRFVEGPRTPASSGRHQRTSSVYYTASWGSPYQPPELSSDKVNHGSQQRIFGSGELEDESPIPQLRFKYLLATNQSPEEASAASGSRRRRRAYASRRNPHFSGYTPKYQGKKPVTGFTEDWIRQYLSGQSNSERENWWSDESATSEEQPQAQSPKRLNRVVIGDWLDLEDERVPQHEAESPTLADFVRHQKAASATLADPHEAGTQRKGRRGLCHSHTGSIFGYPQKSTHKHDYKAEGTLFSKFASPYSTPMEDIDLNLPEPKLKKSVATNSSGTDESTLSPRPSSPLEGNKGADPLNPTIPSTPAKLTPTSNALSPARTGQRPKKRTVWRGKNCVIALPLDESRGKAGGAPLPLTREEIQDRLRSWESEGFDTSNFKLALAGESQSRRPYPSSEDERAERKQGRYSVSIPDRGKWEAYVEQLKEQKLRALGVSFGHEDPKANVSVGPMSRQASSQYAKSPISPALPVSTMTNQSTQLSPILTTTTSSQHSRVESIASPGLQLPSAPRTGPSVPPLASPSQHPLQHQVAPAQPLLSPPPTIRDGQLAVASFLSTRPAHVPQTHVLHQPQPRAVLAHRLYGDNVFGPAEKRDVSNSSTLSSSSWTDSKPTSTDTVLVSSFGKPPEDAAKNITSKLNVEAKEFSFGRTSSTLPRNFSFNSGPNVQSSKHLPSRPSSFSRASSATHGATHRSLNVAAEPFQPSSTLGALSAGNFDFPSPGPTLKQAASRSSYRKSTTEESFSRSSSNGFKGRVFSTGSMAKPPKQSKAVPIVRPDEGADGSSDDVDDGVEDESGRITQGIGRQKRLRRGGADGDDVPQFAIPNEPPTIPGAEPTVEQIGTDEETTPSDKENITPDNEALKATGPRSARLQPVASQWGPSLSKPQTKGSREWDPFQFRSQVEAEQFNAALPRATSVTSQKVSVYEDDDAAEEPQNLSAQEAEIAVAAHLELAGTDVELPIPPSSAGKHSKMSSLSETANSLRYRPSDAISFSSSVGAPTTHDFENCKPINPSGSYPDPTSSSPRALIESPATALRPSEVGSFRADIPQPRKHSPYYESDLMEYDALAQASVEEIDAVMERLNGEDSDLGVERAEHIWGRISPKRAPIPSFDEPTSAPQLLPNNAIRSDAPSPSPSRVKPVYRALPGDREVLGDPVFSAESLDAVKVGMPNRTPIHRLNKADDVPASDWDDVLSPTEEAKLEPRTHFFDNRVNDLVGGLLQQSLGPLEKTLLDIQASLSGLATKPSSRRDGRTFSPDVVDSDADDEDESDDMYRPRTGSPKRDKRLEQIKTVVAEALSAHRQVPWPSQSVGDDVQRDKDSLDPSTSTVDDEVQARKELEDRVHELEKQLHAAEAEKATLHEIAEEKLGERREHDDKHHQTLVQTQMRTAMLEGAQESLQQTVTELQEKNSALEGTLAEYRLSSNNWREEIVKTHEENRALSRTVESLKLQIEESMRVREGLRGKLDRLQESMASAAHDIARDQAAWAEKEGDHKVELEVAAAKLATEEMARAQLEREVERLRLEEKEAIRLGVVVEEASKAKKELQAMVESLRQESLGHQQSIARLENEVQQSKGVRSSEIQAIKASMSADIEAAQHELKMVRVDLESQLARARQQVENAYSDAADAKVTSTSLLQEAMDAQRATIEDLRKDTEDLVRDRETRHRTQLEEIHSQHDRALRNAKEEKERKESHLLERLSLSDSKSAHLQDRVTHLEERLEIAKSAAHAAAQAAQSAKGSSSTGTSTQTASTLAPTQAPPSHIEKISPQALRESILVLQEQLQERERTIESLESEIATFDRSLPAKIRNRDSEVAWLRELLSVRVADLQDVITTISSDQIDFDRDAVKDAAIRLKAGLDMELQERERTTSGGGAQTFPSLASMSAFASPRATQLAAAWGNWRKGKENGNHSAFGNLSEIAASTTPSPSKVVQKQQQQQQQQGTQGFFSGLMTPPKQTSRQGSTRARGGNPRAGRSSDGQVETVTKTEELKGKEMDPIRQTNPPDETPTLLREGEYDRDAEDREGYFR